MMQYWRLRVNPCRDGDYDVFYRTPINLLKINVPREAVNDGDLLNTFMPHVDVVEEITKEVYYEHMYE
jgi:hypothetical protein